MKIVHKIDVIYLLKGIFRYLKYHFFVTFIVILIIKLGIELFKNKLHICISNTFLRIVSLG